jgi:hypothetical protein
LEMSTSPNYQDKVKGTPGLETKEKASVLSKTSKLSELKQLGEGGETLFNSTSSKLQGPPHMPNPRSQPWGEVLHPAARDLLERFGRWDSAASSGSSGNRTRSTEDPKPRMDYIIPLT